MKLSYSVLLAAGDKPDGSALQADWMEATPFTGAAVATTPPSAALVYLDDAGEIGLISHPAVLGNDMVGAHGDDLSHVVPVSLPIGDVLSWTLHRATAAEAAALAIDFVQLASGAAQPAAVSTSDAPPVLVMEAGADPAHETWVHPRDMSRGSLPK